MTLYAHDPFAEQALLGAMMLHPDTAGTAFRSVPIDAYYGGRHGAIAVAINECLVRRQRPDPTTVLGVITEQGHLSRIGGAPYLFALVQAPFQADAAGQYAARLCELYGRRRLVEACTREVQRLDADHEAGVTGRPLSAALETLRAEMDEIRSLAAPTAVAEPTNLHDFLGVMDTWDWLVPNLLERGDRFILTGQEGFGKSELAWQIALCVAGGVHPFTGESLGGSDLRVLAVDCENGPGQSRRRARRIVGAVDACRGMAGLPDAPWSKRLFVEFRPSGLNLCSPADVVDLETMVASVQPDLLLLGPLYKLHTGNINDGEQARTMLDALDRLRERYGFALITEAHPSKGTDSRSGVRTMEPEGSALFMRWPEFGFGLRRNKDDPNGVADVVAWRGNREERDWPAGLHRAITGMLPWKPTAEYWDRPDAGWQG